MTAFLANEYLGLIIALDIIAILYGLRCAREALGRYWNEHRVRCKSCARRLSHYQFRNSL